MLLAAIAIASFVFVGAAVGVRMLRLARRTHELPELMLGAGLCSLVFVTIPAITAGLALKLGPVPLQQTLFVVGLLPTVAFATALHAFTARVFRPRSSTAWSAVVVATLVASAGLTGTAVTRIVAWDIARVVSPQWNILLLSPFVTGLGWSGVESLRYHLRLRRRLALGLVDPIVCDRFFLWAFGGLGAVAGVIGIGVSVAIGWRVIDHPVPIFAIAFAGFSLSICWWLAFLPPQSYLRRVRARAAA